MLSAPKANRSAADVLLPFCHCRHRDCCWSSSCRSNTSREHGSTAEPLVGASLLRKIASWMFACPPRWPCCASRNCSSVSYHLGSIALSAAVCLSVCLSALLALPCLALCPLPFALWHRTLDVLGGPAGTADVARGRQRVRAARDFLGQQRGDVCPCHAMPCHHNVVLPVSSRSGGFLWLCYLLVGKTAALPVPSSSLFLAWACLHTLPPHL